MPGVEIGTWREVHGDGSALYQTAILVDGVQAPFGQALTTGEFIALKNHLAAVEIAFEQAAEGAAA